MRHLTENLFLMKIVDIKTISSWTFFQLFFLKVVSMKLESAKFSHEIHTRFQIWCRMTMPYLLFQIHRKSSSGRVIILSWMTQKSNFVIIIYFKIYRAMNWVHIWQENDNLQVIVSKVVSTHPACYQQSQLYHPSNYLRCPSLTTIVPVQQFTKISQSSFCSKILSIMFNNIKTSARHYFLSILG